MNDMKKLCTAIEEELKKIADKGLTQGNIDIAYKLVDMYKDLKNTNYWDIKSEYYMTVLEEMQDSEYSHNSGNYSMDEDYSMRGRKRDRMGRYSRNDGMSRDDRTVKGNRGYSMNAGHDVMYDRYIDSKMSYRSDKSMDSKQKLMDSLEDYMDDFTEKIKEMSRDADTPEERELINKFMAKLQTIR